MATPAVQLSVQTVAMNVCTKEDLSDVLTRESEKVVIVKFGAEWCEPCKEIAPKYAELLTEFAEHVVSVDAGHDDANELFEEYEVTGMPTFLVFKDSKMAFRLKKPDEHEIRHTLKQTCPRPPLVLDDDF